MVVGGAIALPLEARVCRYRPARSAAARAASLAIGAAGVIALLLLDRSVPPDARLPGSLTAGGAAIWSLLLAPLAFRRLGWAGRGRSPDGNGDHR
jgi:hypothetical protein